MINRASPSSHLQIAENGHELKVFPLYFALNVRTKLKHQLTLLFNQNLCFVCSNTHPREALNAL